MGESGRDINRGKWILIFSVVLAYSQLTGEWDVDAEHAELAALKQELDRVKKDGANYLRPTPSKT